METEPQQAYRDKAESPIDIALNELNSEIEWLSDAVATIDSKTATARVYPPEVSNELQKVSDLPSLQSNLRDKIQTATNRIRNQRMTLESITSGMEL